MRLFLVEGLCSARVTLQVECLYSTKLPSMSVEIQFCNSDLFTNLVGWYTGAVSFPLSDVILAQLAYPPSDVMLCLHSGITNLSLYNHCLSLRKTTFCSVLSSIWSQ